MDLPDSPDQYSGHQASGDRRPDISSYSPPSQIIPSSSNTSRKNHLAIVLLVLAAIVAIVSIFIYARSSQVSDSPVVVRPQSQVSEVAPTPSPKAADDPDWVDHINPQKGVSLRLPPNWEILYAISGESFEIDLKSPDKKTLIFISVSPIKSPDIQSAVSSRKTILSSDEKYQLTEFTPSAFATDASYTATGEEGNFIFENSENVSLENLQVATYRFIEQGKFTADKQIILHGITLSGPIGEDIISKVIASFRLQPSSF